MKETYKSRVYTDRPAYADFDAPRKFNAIQSIVARRLLEHPNAICSYSGGADSDIMIDVIERARAVFDLPPIKYVFFIVVNRLPRSFISQSGASKNAALAPMDL